MDESTRASLLRLAGNMDDDRRAQANIALELADLVVEVRALREAIRNGAIVSHVLAAPILNPELTKDLHTTMIAPDLSHVRLTDDNVLRGL